MIKLDIVTLLRTADGFDLVSETMNEGADEIERLRAVLRGIACTDDTCECGYGEHDGPFCELGRARAALGEKE